MIENEQYYASCDIYSSSYLVAKGVKLVDTENTNHKTTFIFLNPKLCKVLADEFFRRGGSVEPLAYADAIRTLKKIIYQ